MIEKVPFDLFKKGQTIYFNILRLDEFEKSLGDSIINIMFVKKQDNTISFCLNGLRIGLAHHYEGQKEAQTNEFFAEKIQEYLNGGGTLSDIIAPVGKAILVSGIFGEMKGQSEKPASPDDEKNAESPLVQ